MNSKGKVASLAALASALFYGVSVPFVKALEEGASASWTSAFLYLGAGCAMVVLACALRISGHRDALGGEPLGLRQVPLLALMVVLNTASAIALVAGIALSSAAAASLLGNLEVVATAVFAWLIFHEPMTRRFVAALMAITLSGLLLGWEEGGVLLSPGALLIMLACVFWGLENNCTRALADYDVVAVTRAKGIFTGAASAVTAVCLGGSFEPASALPLLGVGAVSYGLSIVLYIWAQRHIGAARTGNLYSIAPFVGAAVSWMMYGFDAQPMFWLALALSALGVILTWEDVSRGKGKESAEEEEGSTA